MSQPRHSGDPLARLTDKTIDLTADELKELHRLKDDANWTSAEKRRKRVGEKGERGITFADLRARLEGFYRPAPSAEYLEKLFAGKYPFQRPLLEAILDCFETSLRAFLGVGARRPWYVDDLDVRADRLRRAHPDVSREIIIRINLLLETWQNSGEAERERLVRWWLHKLKAWSDPAPRPTWEPPES